MNDLRVTATKQGAALAVAGILGLGCQASAAGATPAPAAPVTAVTAVPQPPPAPDVAPAPPPAPAPTFGVVVEGQCSELGVAFFENAALVHYGDIPGTKFAGQVDTPLVLALVRDDGSIDEDPKLAAGIPKVSQFSGMGDTLIPMELDEASGSWPESARLVVSGGGGERIGTRTDTYVWKGDRWGNAATHEPVRGKGAPSPEVWKSGTSWPNGTTLASDWGGNGGGGIESSGTGFSPYPAFKVVRGPSGQAAPTPDFTALHVAEKPTCWFRENARVTRPSGELFVAGKFCGIYPTHDAYPLPEGESAVARWAPGGPATIEAIPPVADHASLSLDGFLDVSPSALYVFGRVGQCNPTCDPYLAYRDGTTWTAIPTPFKGYVIHHELEPDGTLWVEDRDQRLFRRGTDGTWTPQPVAATTSVAWANGRPVWVTTGAGTVMHRADSGDWTQVDLPAPAFSASTATATGAKLIARKVALSPRGEVWVNATYAEHRPEWGMAESRDVLLRLGATHAPTRCEVAKGPSFSSWPAPATAQCESPVAILARVAKSAPADYDFPQTRGAVRGHKELLGSEFAEIDLDGKRLLAAKVPSIEVGSQLVRLVSQSVHGTRPELVCFTPKVTRGVVFDLEATGPAAKATVGKKRR